ncbi:DUF454 domain-containing protein [Pigmentiphaga aceris]|uniref:DUF454 domain-containing protein n=1 Tax=Pigmentiphaga aceris TaxID=1940612 RepID=A0A5C0B540_9BURK|nr:DUF454 domain-containing protein [Pigmentiphaga aceris]
MASSAPNVGQDGAHPSKTPPETNLPDAKPAHPAVRWLWLILAYVSLGLAVIAVFLPGIPSTEFVLLAAWAASKGSPRLRAWLLRHRLFGPIIHNWHNGRVVTRRAKLGASLSMSVALGIMLWTLPDHRILVAVLAVGMACGAAWMWSRPERVRDA